MRNICVKELYKGKITITKKKIIYKYTLYCQFIICSFMDIFYPVLLWFFTKIRYLEHSREEDVKVVPKQEFIELKAQEA